MPKIAPAPPHSIHPDFQNPQADLVLLSSNETRFLVRQVYLESGAEIFDDMFQALRSNKEGQKTDKETGFALIKLEEDKAALALFLRFLVRDVARPKTLELEEAAR